MSRINQILIAAFVVQIGLFFLVGSSKDERAISKAEALLPAFDAAKVTKIAIFGNSKATSELTFRRRGDGWIVASHSDYPVKESKLKPVIGALATIASRGATTTSKDHHKKFKVADDDFEAKLIISQDGQSDVILYVGSSLGFRRSYVRLDKQDEVHSVSGLANVSTTFKDWVDTSLLNINKTEASQIRVENKSGIFDFAQASGSWALKSAPGCDQYRKNGLECRG